MMFNYRSCELRLSLTLAFFAVLFLANCHSACRSATKSEPPNRLASASPEQVQTSNFLEKVWMNERGERMSYLLFLPKGYDKKVRYPLVLWLHGGGSRGDDPKQLLAYGDQHGIGYLARGDNQSKYPALIVAPQCPRNRFWANPDSSQPTTQLRLVLEILDRVQADYSIDRGRLYVLGISLGGYGTWEIIARRPRMFAAAVPICGGGNTANASLMKKTQVWAFHGDEDELVSVSESRRMIAALKQAGANPRYTEYKGVGHNAWVRAFAEPDLLQWMFAQRTDAER